MSLDFQPKEYTQWHSPFQSVIEFFKDTLTALDWDRIEDNDLVMDVGCGPGGTTKDIILPFFPKVKKIIALDLLPDMINIAKEENAHPQIEYVVADISNWSTVQQWEEKITKIVSVHCFHWVKHQKEGFQNIYRLLKSGGEAALYFVMEGTFFDVTEKLQNSPKWSQYLKGIDNRIPDSHRRKCGASFYKKLLEEMGFEIMNCEEKEKFDICASEEAIRNYCSSLCVLEPHIPREHAENFKNDMVQEIVKSGGRTDTGNPRHVGKIIEMIVRKNSSSS